MCLKSFSEIYLFRLNAEEQMQLVLAMSTTETL